MIPKISFRYGYGAVEKCGLLLWTFSWAIGLFFILRSGVVNSGQPGGAVEYSRADEPVSYWTIVAMTFAMFILGLALTFEMSFKDGKSSDVNEKRE